MPRPKVAILFLLAYLSVSTPISAQSIRFDLGQRLRRLEAQFEKDLELYTTWFNSDVYDAILLEKDDDGDYSERERLYSLDDTTKVNSVCNMLDEALQTLNKDCPA